MVRIKHRYLIIQVTPTSDKIICFPILSIHDILNAIRDKIQELHGDVGSGLFGRNINSRFYNADLDINIFVIRVPRECEQDVRFAVACLNSINCKSTKRGNVVVGYAFRLLEVCGSSRTCKEKLTRVYCNLLYVCGQSHNQDKSESNEMIRFRNMIENTDI